MKKKFVNLFAYGFIVLGVMAVILNVIANNVAFGGNWGTIAGVFVGTIPYLGFMVLGFISFATGRIGFLGTSLMFGIIGVANAGLVNYLYVNNVWFDQAITAPNTIEDYMIIIVLVWFILGVAVGAFKRE